MIREAMQFLTDLAGRSKGLQVVDPPLEHKRRYILYDAVSGKTEWRDSEVNPRNHTAGDLDTVIAWAQRDEAQDEVLDEARLHNVVVWYHRSGVVVVLNDLHHRDYQVRLPLALSPQVRQLQHLEPGGGALSQADLVRLLRTTLAGCCEPQVLAAVRSLKLKRTEDGESAIRPTGVSLGRSLRAEATGDGPIPESVAFRVPIFAAGIRDLEPQEIECALDLDLADEKFRLVPLAGEIEDAIAVAEALVGQRLRTALEELPVYYGTP